MSIHFHPLAVKKIKKETADCVSITFEIPETLKELYTYQQGQSLTLRTQLHGEEVRRTYSLCSSPLDHEWKVAVKKVEGGVFSTYANEELKAGDVLEVMPPVGKFNTPLHPEQKKHYVAFAAGSGITPVLSLLKTILRTEPQSRFTLVFGNRSRASIIFFEELEAIKNKYLDRFQLIHVLSRERMDTPLHSGRIDGTKLDALSKLIPFGKIDEYFLCGPEEMIFCVRDYLEASHVPKNRIHFELFTTAGSRVAKKSTPQETGTPTGPQSHITIKADGRSIEFNLPLDADISLLDAALKHGADLPFACKGGVCCTCKARLLEGEVSMDVHWGLEDHEVAEGYILTCQSHPRTDKVSVDFDIK